MDAVGRRADSCSAVAMPSMPGMLMSMSTTAGCRLAASSSASAPEAAAPTTSMSLSNPSSFVRCSGVSGMSSTMRTRMRSAICFRLRFGPGPIHRWGARPARAGRRRGRRGGGPGGGGGWGGGEGAVGPARPAPPTACCQGPRRGGTVLLRWRRYLDGEVARQDAPLLDELEEGDAGGDVGRRVPVAGRPQHEGEVPVELREADQLDLLRREPQDDDLLLPGE